MHITATHLSTEAEHSLSDSIAYSGDAHTVLDAMNAVQTATCTDADLDFLRQLLYRSHYLKALGRIRDNHIACSTVQDHSPQSELPKPSEIGADGIKIYENAPIFSLPLTQSTALQSKDSYVVLNPFVYTLRRHSESHFQTTILWSPTGHTPGIPQDRDNVSTPILTRNADFRFGDMLYSTRCSSLYNTCVTVSLSVYEALESNRTQFHGFIFFGSLSGVLLGLLVSMAWLRSRGMESQLRRAIRHNTLRMVYQPIVNLSDGRTAGAEALARWTDEDGCTVSPEIFVHIAESGGFISDLTRLVLHQVLRDFGPTLRSRPEFHVNVNVTAADLANTAFPQMLEAMLCSAGVEARSLGIEITESSSAQLQTIIESIRQLRHQGHPIYIDDFGTGYSSLSYLKDLSVDAIKIDRAFTKAIGTEAVTVGILPQILAMAEALNLQVVAEGIETREQADFFSAAAIPVMAQGWYFGFPFTSAEFHRLLASSEHAEAVLSSV